MRSNVEPLRLYSSSAFGDVTEGTAPAGDTSLAAIQAKSRKTATAKATSATVVHPADFAATAPLVL